MNQLIEVLEQLVNALKQFNEFKTADTATRQDEYRKLDDRTEGLELSLRYLTERVTALEGKGNLPDTYEHYHALKERIEVLEGNQQEVKDHSDFTSRVESLESRLDDIENESYATEQYVDDAVNDIERKFDDLPDVDDLSNRIDDLEGKADPDDLASRLEDLENDKEDIGTLKERVTAVEAQYDALNSESRVIKKAYASILGDVLA